MQGQGGWQEPADYLPVWFVQGVAEAFDAQLRNQVMQIRTHGALVREITRQRGSIDDNTGGVLGYVSAGVSRYTGSTG